MKAIIVGMGVQVSEKIFLGKNFKFSVDVEKSIIKILKMFLKFL